MSAKPFDALAPAPGVDHASWIVDATRGRDGIAHVVPDVFEACIRVHHPLRDGTTWAIVAPSYLRNGSDAYPYPFPVEISSVEGDLTAAGVDALLAILDQEATTRQLCHFGLWVGWGELHPHSHTSVFLRVTSSPFGRLRNAVVRRRLHKAEIRKARATYAFVDACPVVRGWGGRDTLLFDGPIAGVRSIGTGRLFDDDLHRRSPQWWWPEDRSWFVGTEIDYPWTYVAGATALIDRIRQDSDLETVPVAIGDEW